MIQKPGVPLENLIQLATVDLNQTLGIAYFNLAAEYEHIKDLDQALDYYNRALVYPNKDLKS